MEEVLVSIWCTAYNHGAYIRDAIEGFLAQRTSFKYEILIHDDASTDNTAEIVKEYEKKYPDFIRGIYQTENQYSKNHPSGKWIQKLQIQNCRGKYVAYCEGDDYWIDVQKLQRQVDYLEAHPECVAALHNGVVADYEEHKLYAKDLYEKDCLVFPGDIITQKAIPLTASMVCRCEVIEMDELYSNVGIGDYPMLLYCLTKGAVYYCSRIMSVYRFRHPGSWTSSVLSSESSVIIHNVSMIHFLKLFNIHTKDKYEKYTASRIQKSVTRILEPYEQAEKSEFLNLCKRCNKKTEERYGDIFEQLQKMYFQIADNNYLDSKLLKFTDENKRLVIMGAGKYAKILAGQLENNGIEFEGFTVSDSQWESGTYLGKPVWKLGEISKETAVIVGINPVIWDQIVDALDEAQIVHYSCPFLME